MATFYVLPPRECLEEATAEFCRRILPGATIPTTLWEELLAHVAATQSEAYFIHREDLPGSGDTIADLVDAFGAEPGHTVVEIGLAVGGAPGRVRRSIVTAAVSEVRGDR